MILDVDEILPYIGEYGRFQKIMIAMITMIYFTMSYEILIIYFSTMIPSWECVPNSAVCLINGTLPSDDHRRCNMTRSEWQYTENHYYSLATQFDIKCGEEWKLELTSAIFFVGWGVGSIVFGWMGDRYGRKITLFPCLAAIFLLTFISQFLPYISLIIVCRLIIGFLIPSAIIQPSILITEIVGTKYRPLSGLIPQFAYPLGYCFLGLKAYLLKNWRMLSILCTAPYIWMLGFYVFIPESVRFLLQNGRNDEAMAILRRIAHWNKKTIPSDVTIQTKTSISEGKYSTLFNTRKALTQTLVLCGIWLSSAMSFYGLHLAANDLDGNIYTNFIYLGAIGFPGVLIDIYLCEKYGRRHAILIPLFLAAVCCVAVAFIPFHLKIPRVVFGVLGKCLATASLEGLLVWTAEIFPTDVRSKGMGVANMAGRIGATSSPFVAIGLKPFGRAVPFAVMAVPAFIFSILGIYLPETKDAKKMDFTENDTLGTVIGNEMADIKRMEQGS